MAAKPLRDLAAVFHLRPPSCATLINVYFTDFAIDISFCTRQFPAESQLLVDLTLRTDNGTTTKTLGPFTRASEWGWELRAPFKINTKTISAKLVGYFREDPEQSEICIGFIEIDEKRLSEMRLAHKSKWSDMLRDRDNEPKAKIVVDIVRISERHLDNSDGADDSSTDIAGTATQLASSTQVFSNPSFWTRPVRRFFFPEEHLVQAARLYYLGILLRRKFEHTAILTDIDEAIKILQHSVWLTPDGIPQKPTRLSNLGISFRDRFRRTGMHSDIEETICNQRQAVLLTPDGDPDKPTRLADLGIFLQNRFECTGLPVDIEEAIEIQRQATLLTSDEHPDKPARLNNLGIFLRMRFKQTGDLSDIEEAIKITMEAVLLTPDGHASKPTRLNSLANSFQSRFERTGMLNDIEDAIKNFQHAVSLIPDGHPHKPGQLSNLGFSLQRRFERTGQLRDIEEAIRYQQQAVLLAPDGHPDKPGLLNNLGSSFQRRFMRTGVLSDIEESIKNNLKAVSLTPDGRANKPTLFNNLGTAFQIRFERTGILGDVEEAIENLRHAVSLTPDGHLDKPARLRNLGTSFHSRFGRTGDTSDIEQAIHYQQQAVLLTPDGHPDKPGHLNNLGSSFCRRFEMTGALNDIEEAIKHQQRAISLTPDGHPDKPGQFSNLGAYFQSRYTQTRVLSDIEEAIKNKQEAVLLTPDGHPRKAGYLNNLGISFKRRFERTGALTDIEETIKNLQHAVSLTPDGHPAKPRQLSNLGASFRNLFSHTEALGDIEKAIKALQEAVMLTPDGDVSKPGQLANLGDSFLKRFWHLGVLSDVDKAIKNQQQVVLLTPDGHRDKSGYLFTLANSFYSRFERTRVPDDLNAAESHFRSAATSRSGLPSIRSQSWRELARLLAATSQSASALDAYRLAIDLIPEIAWIGDPISTRHSQLTRLDDLSREAAAFALNVGQLDLALEWLEQGRSIVWNQLLHLRFSDSNLQQAHPEVYEEFTAISHELQRAAIRDQGTTHSSDAINIFEEETQRHHRLAEKWDSMLAQIRSLRGFEDFLLPIKVTRLRKAAEHGPVVIINIHHDRCDALVLLSGSDGLHHIPLDQLSYADVEEMLKWQKHDLTKYIGVRGDVRATGSYKTGGPRLEKILSILFLKVARPILQGLDIIVKRLEPPRIWWCPTGPLTFLPLHAAGIDTADGREEISDYVVSSYIPSVNALLEARAGNRRPFEQLVGIAMIENPLSHGLNPLPNARKELEIIRNIFPAEPGWRFKTLRNEQATTERVLTDMAESSWVHLACHAVQDTKEPMQSGLWLHDGRLTIADLVSQRFENADLAFLSACQTATGDEKSLDEAVHITAAMLGAGYRSIVGTMWSIPDAVAPILAGNVYEKLLSARKPDSEMAARALHEGVKKLRESGEHSSYSWVPFVHYGL